jgi:hypothetical protein
MPFIFKKFSYEVKYSKSLLYLSLNAFIENEAYTDCYQ